MEAIPLDEADETAGTLGPITAENHNKYEVYSSPRTTRRRIEAVVARHQQWQPLSDELMPEGLNPTPNFLGYGPLRNNAPASLECIDDLHFPPDNGTLNSRIQYCPELKARVNLILNELAPKVRIEPAVKMKKRSLPGNVGYLQVNEEVPSNTPLSLNVGILFSSNSAGKDLSNTMYLCGLHRRRTNNAPGFSFTGANDEAPEGWLATINRNFEMLEPFTPVRGNDSGKLRQPCFREIPPNGTRLNFISTSMEKCKIKRP